MMPGQEPRHHGPMSEATEEQVSFRGLPERIELPDAVLRRLTRADLPALVDAVNSTLDTLRPWMPWAQQPVTIEGQTEWFNACEEMWRTGTGFNWIVVAPAGDIMGGVGYHVRNGPGVLEIGYWLRASYEGRGIMTRIAAALTETARQVDGVERIEIHTDVDNVRSAAIPQRLGYALIDVRDAPRESPAATGRQQIWSIDA